MFSTLYRLSQNFIINKIPHEQRVSSILYVDTDSIFFSKNLCANINFHISEELGHYEEDKCDFFTTWGTKYGDAEWIIIYSKKSYIIGKKQQIMSCKLKGIHKWQADLFTYDNFIKLLTNKKIIKFMSLQRVKKELFNYSKSSNYIQDFVVDIIEAEFQKTLQIETFEKHEILKCENEQVYELNKEIINKEIYKQENDFTYNYSVTFLFR